MNRRRITGATPRFTQRWSQARFLALLLALALLGVAAPTVTARPIPTLYVAPNLPFAFSDFDGDQKPDSVAVQTGRSSPAFTDYWILLQFANLQTQTIRVVAKTGGVQVAARDVNGDRIPDVVVSTFLFKQTIAILLNDGHGSFSPADPAAFADTSTGLAADWNFSAPSPRQVLEVRPRPQQVDNSSPAPRQDLRFFAATNSFSGVPPLVRPNYLLPFRGPPLNS